MEGSDTSIGQILNMYRLYEATDTSLQDWGYEQYGIINGSFAYMDPKHPTRKNADGNIKNMDLLIVLNKLIKDNNNRKYLHR